jgi:hypothetical protein
MHAWARKTILISCEIKGCLTFRSFIDIYFIAGADALNQYRAVAFTLQHTLVDYFYIYIIIIIIIIIIILLISI